MAKQNVEITQDYWNSHPEIQADYKVGDMLEVDVPDEETVTPGANGGSSVLDGLGKEFGMMKENSKQITLPSGKQATIFEFKGKHVFKAQRFLADIKEDGKSGLDMMPIIISICTLIDGKAIVPEDLNEMAGQDVLELMGEFSAANFSKS